MLQDDASFGKAYSQFLEAATSLYFQKDFLFVFVETTQFGGCVGSFS